VIEGHTTIGKNNRIFQFCSLGAIPQDKKYAGEPTRLEIGDGNTIREFVTTLSPEIHYIHDKEEKLAAVLGARQTRKTEYGDDGKSQGQFHGPRSFLNLRSWGTSTPSPLAGEDAARQRGG